MRTITISEGITLTASKEVIRSYEAQVAERQWRIDAIQWLREATEAGDWDFYSDLHKDLYGVRPH